MNEDKRFKLVRFLNRPIIKAVTKSIPFLGDVTDNLRNDTFESPQGHINPSEVIYPLVRLAVLGALLWAVLSGKISWGEAEQAKDFIGQ